MLHDQTDAGDAHPTAGTHENGLAAGFDQLDQVGVQTDGGHSPDDEELGQLLKGLEDGGIHTGQSGDRGDDGGQNEQEDKEGEDLFQLEGPVGYGTAPLHLPGAPESKNQGDGDNSQSPGELDDGSVVEDRTAGVV